jgi:broad specificity phosphatase PhoE
MVYVARHGEPLVGRGGKESRLEDELQTSIATHWSKTTKMPQNPPLTRRGKQQGRELGEQLIGKGITHIYCSPFTRCVQTAEAAAEVLNCPFRVETGLCEWLIKPWYPTDPRPQMCADSIHEVYHACDPSYSSVVKEVEYPEADDHMRHRLEAVMKHMVGDGHGASGLNFGSILVIAHASGIERLCQALVPYASIPPTPFCSLTAMEKCADGSWMMNALLDHDFLSQGHTLSDFKPSHIPLPGTGGRMNAMDADGDGVMTRDEWMKSIEN